ncbi:MAG TPA: cupin domain-containing protein [Thermoanaerobaculia bacterium]
MNDLHIDDVTPLVVGPGCSRRDLPSTPGVRVWIVEMEPGSQWPHVDHHPTGEEFLVLSGEVIEGERRFGPGTYVHFEPGSQHQPRTETGVRLFGINVVR